MFYDPTPTGYLEKKAWTASRDVGATATATNGVATAWRDFGATLYPADADKAAGAPRKSRRSSQWRHDAFDAEGRKAMRERPWL